MQISYAIKDSFVSFINQSTETNHKHDMEGVFVVLISELMIDVVLFAYFYQHSNSKIILISCLTLVRVITIPFLDLGYVNFC